MAHGGGSWGEGYVRPVLKYWLQHSDPPEDVRERLRARKEQEDEQLREKKKREEGRGKTIWKQALLPVRAPSPDREAWKGEAVR